MEPLKRNEANWHELVVVEIERVAAAEERLGKPLPACEAGRMAYVTPQVAEEIYNVLGGSTNVETEGMSAA